MRTKSWRGAALLELDPGLQACKAKEEKRKEAPSSLNKVLLGATVADYFKAQEIVILDVSGLSSFADYFLICSGKSSRQVQGIVERVEMSLRREGIRPLGVEGRKEGHWVLMDYGDVIIHVFYEPVRHFYDLESLWSEAERIDWEDRKGEQGTSCDPGRGIGLP